MVYCENETWKKSKTVENKNHKNSHSSDQNVELSSGGFCWNANPHSYLFPFV